MRKFSIRALACSLAAVLVAGLAAPAVASADVLLISPAPSKAENVLHITADMVDDDGEIVISGGNYDRVFVSKEAAAKDIYFDQVTVGELVVEGGNKANVQLWEVDAEKVTVQEPQLEKLSLLDLLPLLKDPETQDAAIAMYQQSLAKDNYALGVAPTIVTMDDAKVDELVTRTNVKLDLGAGEVGEVALKASATQNRVNVTLSNYEGNVSYKGGDGFSSVTLKSVDSRIKNLKVDESNANNYFTVTGKNAIVMNTEVAGNANVALNAMMGAVEVTEEATAANLTLLNVAEELTVAGKGANIQLSGNANVTFATVTSDDVKITGVGSLGEADLQGKGAYVSTFGTKVEGENTYVRPVYVQPKVVVTDINLTGGEGAVVTKNSDGSSTVVYTPKHKTASFVVPEEVDKDRISSVKIELTYNGQFCVKFGGTSKEAEYPGWGASGETDGEFTYSINCAKDKLSRLDFMCLEAPLELTIKKITFNLLDEAPEPEPEAPAPEQNAPSELPENYVVYGIDDLTKSGYGYKATEAAHGGEHVALGESYQEVRYNFAEDIDLSQYSKMILTFATKSPDTSDCVVIKLVDKDASTDEWGNPNPIDTLWDKTTSNTADFAVDLSKYAGKKLSWVTFSSKDNASELYFYRIAFVPKEAQEEAKTTYTFNEFTEVRLWEATTNVDATTGAITMSFPGQWKQAFYEIPEAIDMTKVESVTLNGLVGNTYCIKLQTAEEYAAGGDAAVLGYDNATVETGGAAVKYLVFMSNSDSATAEAPQVITVESVTFNLIEEEIKDTYNFKELTEVRLWEATTNVDSTTGAITMSFPGQWKQAFYEIPEAIDMTKVESVTLNGLVGNTYCIKLQTAEEYTAGGDAAVLGYDNATIETGGAAVKYLVFMSNSDTATAEAPQVITVESVTFNLQ